MRVLTWSIWLRHGVAVGSAIGAALLAVPVQALIAGKSPFITFFPAVIIAAVLAGTGPGLLCGALSALAVATILMHPIGLPWVTGSEEMFALGLFLFECILIACVGGGLREAQLRQKRTESTLREKERWLRLAQGAGGVGTYWFDPRTGRSEGSEVFHRLFEIDARDTCFKMEQWERMLHPDDRARVLEELQRAFASPQVAEFRGEYRIVRSGGVVRWLAYAGQIIRAAGGEALRVYGTVMDTTDRKGTEQALRRSEDRLRLLADAGAVLAASLDYERTLSDLAHITVPRLADWCAIDIADGPDRLRRVTVVHADPARVQLAHELDRRYPPDRNVGHGVYHVLRTGRPELGSEVSDKMLVRAARDVEHLRILRELKLRSYMCVPLIARGRVIGVLTLVCAESGRTCTPEDLALAEDLARRAAVAIDHARLFEAERAARTEAERASRLKDEFLATLSHELRTPLNAILGWSQLLSQRNDDDAELVTEGVSIISRNAQAQRQLIEDLLDMSRIVAGKLRLEVRPVNPADVVEAAVESVSPSIAAKGLRIETALDRSAGTVLGDPGRLQQVVWNLLTNAVKFTERDGLIGVTLRRAGGEVEIEVSDTGQGIKPEFLPLLFGRFQQADASTTRRHGGLGLGLALVRQLVEFHGGGVHARSPGEGHGTIFTVRLPIAAPQEEVPQASAIASRIVAASEEGIDLAGLRVLVVDDEPDGRDIARRIIEERGAEVEAAGSAKEALEAIQRHRPDVIISDIGMPETDGYELMRCVRQLPSGQGGDTPAAALTAFARPEDRRLALNAGFQAHIVKPFEPMELVAVVATLAGRTGHSPAAERSATTADPATASA